MLRLAWTLILLAVPAVLAVPSPPAQAGVVQTAAGRLEGKVALQADHVTVGEKQVAWKEVLYLLPDDRKTIAGRPQRVRLRNGEVWPVEVGRLAEKKLTVKSELFGEKAIDLGLLAAIEFAPQAGARSRAKPQTLYRAKGSPITGALLGLDGDKLNMDSPLGALNLPREGLVSYVFTENVSAWEREIDEVALIDGTILRGKLQPGADGLKLEHPLVGSVSLPGAVVRSIVRHTAAILDLTELLPAAVQTLPLTVGTGQSARFQTARGDDTAHFVKGLLIEPKTVVRYRLPAGEAKAAQLRLVLGPVDSAQGDVKLRVRTGKTVKMERDVAAGARPEEVSLELSAGEELEIEIDFGSELRFPCGVILGDPHLLLK